VIHPAVPAPDAAAAGARGRLRALGGAGDAEVVLVLVGRMEPWKGHAVLIDALGRLAALPGWRCWMVGGAQRPAEARYQARLQRRARRRGIESRITWLGERRDVPALLAAADLCVQPSTTPEPFGMAMVEALYAGRPVVAADHGGAPEVVDDSAGVRFAPGDAGALAEALRGLITDGGRRAALGARAPARAAALCDPRERQRELAEVLRPLVAGRAA
jgi:glycosyltransferase involved in cell wall biosynthesis